MKSENSLRAMLLDDDKYTLVFVGDMLRDLGISDVLTADNGEEVLALVDSVSPKLDVILCDLSMPDMDGIDFLARLGRRGYSGWIILISGYHAGMLSVARVLAERYGLNILETLKKPINRDELAAALARVAKM